MHTYVYVCINERYLLEHLILTSQDRSTSPQTVQEYHPQKQRGFTCTESVSNFTDIKRREVVNPCEGCDTTEEKRVKKTEQRLQRSHW